MMPSATPDSMSSWSSVLLRSLDASCWTASWHAFCATAGSPLDGDTQAVPAPVPPVPPMMTWLLAWPAPASPLALERSVTVPGSCWATRKYVMTSRAAPEARNSPT
jgi:hypothetical protein